MSFKSVVSAMMSSKKDIFPIENDMNIAHTIANVTRKNAQEFGFSTEDIAKITTAILECTTNIVKYAYSGFAQIEFIQEKKDRYLKMVFEDKGPKIPDIVQAFAHGYSSSNTLGLGLNVILNSMDSMKVIPKEDGMRIVVKKYLEFSKNECQFFKEFKHCSIGFKSLPYTFLHESGDCALSVLQENGDILFAHWDISGHGSQEVFRNSQILKKYLTTFEEYSLDEIVTLVNSYFLRDESLREFSFLIASLSHTTNTIDVRQFGNISFSTVQNAQVKRYHVNSASMGKQYITPYTIALDSIDIFISYSDGVNVKDLKGDILCMYGCDSYEISDLILQKYHDINDDASVLTLKIGKDISYE